MAATTEPEDRLLNAAELEMVGVTRSPEIQQLSVEQLKDLTRRLRQARERATDVGARQKREMRGKAEPHGAKPAHDNAGTIGKAQALADALERVEIELRRREGVESPEPTAVELARHALELKLSAQAANRPDPGRSASGGMHTKERQKSPKLGTTRKEVGRVSQAGKVAQARKDAKR